MICWPSSAPSDDVLAEKEVEPTLILNRFIYVKDDLHEPGLSVVKLRKALFVNEVAIAEDKARQVYSQKTVAADEIRK